MTQFIIPKPDLQITFYHRLKECWTMVGVLNLDMALARRESPTTDRFYLIENLTEGNLEFEDFRENLLSRVGIKG